MAQDISDIIMVLDNISGMIMACIKHTDDPDIKTALGWHLLYPLQQMLKTWNKSKKHGIVAYKGFSLSLD